MKHPYDKFIRIELFAIVLAVIIFIFILIKQYILITVIPLLLISISMTSEGVIFFLTHQKMQAIKQFSRAIIIILLTVYLFLKIV